MWINPDLQLKPYLQYLHMNNCHLSYDIYEEFINCHVRILDTFLIGLCKRQRTSYVPGMQQKNLQLYFMFQSVLTNLFYALNMDELGLQQSLPDING